MNDGQSTSSSDATFKTTHPTGETISTKNAGTTVTGVTTTTVAGVQQVSVNKSTTSGTTTVEGNSVTVTNPGNGWSSLKYSGTTVVDDGKDISINGIQNVVMESEEVTADLGGNIGTASAQIDVALSQLVSGVTIQQNIIQGATTSVASAFQLAAASSNLDIKSVAYTVEFKNTADLNANLGAAGVTLNLGVDQAWVEANGGRSNIKILRFAEDGTKEVLSTTYTSSSDTTDYFKALSPHGLSTFGMTAVASTTGGGGGGDTGGGSSETSSSSASASSIRSGGSSSDRGVSGARSAVEQAVAPVVEQINEFLAPFQETGTTTQPISVAGLTAKTGPAGNQEIRLDTALARQSGATVTLTNNVITIGQPGFILTVITGETAVEEKGIVSGTIQSVELRTTPASAQTGSGTVSFSLETFLSALPENAAITTSISENVNPDILDAFHSAARANNLQIESVAYSVVVGKTSLAATGPATVTLTIPPGWVMDHGGIPSIGVAHLSDDGTSDLLVTEYTGTDDTGNLIFQAPSPEGLSAFGLVSLRNQTGTAPASGTYPSTERISADSGGIGRFIADNIVLVIVILMALLTMGVGILLYEIRSDNRKRLRKKEP